MGEFAKFLRYEGSKVEPNYSDQQVSSNGTLLHLFEEKKIEVCSKEVDGVICIDTEEFVAMILMNRNLDPEDAEIKIGIDSGQGTLKVTLSITPKPDEAQAHAEEVPTKRRRYAEGYSSGDGQLSSSVHKTFILALFETKDESYETIETILRVLKMENIKHTISEDIKVALIMVGKQTAAARNPCPYCESSYPEMVKGTPYTLSSLRLWNQKYLENGGKKKEAKEFQNVIHQPLIIGDPGTKVIEILNIPGLHIILGIVDKLLKLIEEKLFVSKQEGFQSMNVYLKSINLGRVSYQGQHRLEGNSCMRFLDKVDTLEVYFRSNGLGLTGAPYIKVLRCFKKVVSGSFAKTVSPSYPEDIAAFSRAYRELDCNIPVKVHIVEQHVPEFLKMKGNVFGE